MSFRRPEHPLSDASVAERNAAKVQAQDARIKALEEALRRMYAEHAEYAGHLYQVDVEVTRTAKIARTLLSTTEPDHD